MKRLLLTVLLLSVAVAGFADPSDLSNLPGNGNVVMGTIPGTDMSVKYLGQLFGSVGGVLDTSSHVQILQEMFGIFNKAILALALAWTGYTIVTLMFNSAMEGGFITSQRKNAVFIFARLALGFSLLLPLSSGYSGLQVIGMRALLEGVNLANKVWDEAVYFITYKGILYDYADKKGSSSDVPTVDANGWNKDGQINSATNLKNNPTGSQALVYNMLCTAYYANTKGGKASQGPIYVPGSDGNATQYINFPNADSDTGCGQYRLTDASGSQNMAQGQIQQSMVSAMWPVAQDIVSQNLSSQADASSSSIDVSSDASTLADALANYVASTQLNIENNKPKTKDDETDDKTWEVQAADQGWFGAGRFYWLISQANWYNVQNQSSASSTTTSADIPWPGIAHAATGAIGQNSVKLASDGLWDQDKAPHSTDIKSSLNTKLIPITQAAIQGNEAVFSSDPSGMISYNGNGLCVDDSTLGNMSQFDNAGIHDFDGRGSFNNLDGNLHGWMYDGQEYNNIPSGIDDSGNQTYSANFVLLSSISDTNVLNALKGNKVKMGACGTVDPTSSSSHTFNRPVLVEYNDSYGVGNATRNAAKRARSNGHDYPGVRLCPRTDVSTIDYTQSMTSQIGFCDTNMAQYANASGMVSGVVTDVRFESQAIDGPDYAMPVVPEVLSAVGNKFAALQTQKSEGLTDPLYFMTQLGMTMLGQAGYLWEQGSDHIKSMAAAAGAFSAIGAGATVFNGYISWWEPVFMMLGGGLFVAGFMLCFYAPLYPFVLFTLGALTWLMVCVEFMIALPLVALGVTHPEGHDFLGKAEIALMLTLSACLRPVLMIFGYIGGMVMSFIGFSAVNYMFSSVMVFVFGKMYLASGVEHSVPTQGATPTVFQSIFGVVTNDWTGATSQANSKLLFSGNETTDMLLLPLLMVFYGYIVVEIVHYCFTMIHQLPDQVLRWIGGPVQQDRTQGVAEKIRSGVQGAAKQAGDMGGKGAIGEGKATGGAIGGSIGGGIQVAADVAKMAAAG